MKNLIGLVVVAAIAAGGWFGGSALGLWGASTLSEEEVVSGLQGMVDEVAGEDDGVRYDDWSRLTSAELDGTTATFGGTTILDAADLSEGYFDSRTAQAANFLCSEESSRTLLTSGATFIYNWVSADGEEIGTVEATGAEWCADQGY